jgi:two-component system cell cycle sensor histidine kinase/response regulator CckA
MQAAHSPARVLVVDDEGMILRVVSAILRRAGFEVQTADSAAHAWQLLDQSSDPVDLLLTDVVMRDVSGMALAAMCREKRPDLPILFMTGRRDLVDLPGPTLVKPFAAGKLIESVRQALGAD